MRKVRPAAAVLPAAVLLLGCTCQERREAGEVHPAEAPAPPEPTPAAPETPGPGEPGELFSCVQNRDCVNSCHHGAVSRAWYAAHYPGGEDCRGGCAAPGYQAPRCVSGVCTAFREGAPCPECTRKEAEVQARPGPAHTCDANEDCMLSCMYGAVNAGWYAASPKLRGECKGGCADKEHSARCEQGACVAYRGDQKSSDCTRRPIFQIF